MKFLCMKQTLYSGPSVASSFSHGACVGHKIFPLKIYIKKLSSSLKGKLEALKHHKPNLYIKVFLYEYITCSARINKYAEQKKFAAIRYSKIYSCAAKLKESIWHCDLYQYKKFKNLTNYDWFCLLTL